MKERIKNFFLYFLIAGIGWVIDFSLYTVLTMALDLPVALSNGLSSLVSVTFVFFMSTKKVLTNNTNGLPLAAKYVVYVVYQACMILAMSALAGQLNGWLLGLSAVRGTPVLARNTKIITKILITPVTMVVNYLVLKRIVEGRRHGER